MSAPRNGTPGDNRGEVEIRTRVPKPMADALGRLATSLGLPSLSALVRRLCDEALRGKP